MEYDNSDRSPAALREDAAPGDEVQQVEAEREPDPAGAGRAGEGRSSGTGGKEGFSFRFASFGTDGIKTFSSSSSPQPGNPPRLAAWICLVLAWIFLGSSKAFTVFLGVPLDLVALLLATVCMARGGVLTGVVILALGTVGSFAVYLVGLFRFLFLA